VGAEAACPNIPIWDNPKLGFFGSLASELAVPGLSSIYSNEYRQLLRLLVAARRQAGLSQKQLAGMLGRPQSFVSKFERAERRLDVIEFLRVSRFLRADPYRMLKQVERRRR
jgi:hypothetical protein